MKTVSVTTVPAKKPSHNPVNRMWCYRVELTCLAVLACLSLSIAWLTASFFIAVIMPVAIMVAGLAVSFIPVTKAKVRSYPVSRWLGKGLIRRRTIAFFIATRVVNTWGKYPWILWTTTTPAGYRLYARVRAGHSAESMEDRTEELRAACNAMDAIITRNKKQSAYVTIDIITRDVLSELVPSPLADRIIGALSPANPRPLSEVLAALPEPDIDIDEFEQFVKAA